MGFEAQQRFLLFRMWGRRGWLRDLIREDTKKQLASWRSELISGSWNLQ